MSVAAPRSLGSTRGESREPLTLYSLCLVGVPVSALAIYTIASSPLVAPPIGGPGGLLESALRVVPLAIGAPLLFRHGVGNARLSFAVLGWMLAWSISLLAGDHLESWTMQGAVAMVTTYAGPWALTAALLTAGDARRIVATVAVLPAVSLVVALPLSFAGLFDLMELDPATGRERLGGLMISASWASLALLAVLASALMIATHRRSGWLWLSAAVAILLLSQGRGAMVTLAIAGSPLVLRMLVRGPREPRERYLHRVVAIVVVAALALVAARAVFQSRGEVIPVPIYLSEVVEQSDPTSGRTRAWSYFIDAGRESPIVGHGASTVYLLSQEAEDPLISKNFKAAHNEYVQVFVEFGAVGLLLVIIGIVAEVRYLRLRTLPSLRVFPAVFALAFAAFAATDNATGALLALPLCLLLAACSSIRLEEAAPRRDGLAAPYRGSRTAPAITP